MKEIKRILDKLNFCNCGNPENVFETLKKTLEVFEAHDWDAKANRQKEWQAETKDLALLVTYLLDGLALLDHGGDINGSWLSRDGDLLLEHLRIYGTDPDSWPE